MVHERLRKREAHATVGSRFFWPGLRMFACTDKPDPSFRESLARLVCVNPSQYILLHEIH